MPQVLDETTVDPVMEQEEADLSAAEQELADEAVKVFQPADRPGDLSDGGKVGGATIKPRNGGVEVKQGRAAARRAYTWDGAETLLPLAWNPDGTEHDYARRYLRKRHCLCCMGSGFKTRACPSCVKNSCAECNSSTVDEMQYQGKTTRVIIPAYYLTALRVPFPTQFYGEVDCFLEPCVRRNTRGFLTDQAMRMHARTRHTKEYQVHLESRAAKRADDVQDLRELVREQASQIASLMDQATQPVGTKEAKK